MLTNEQKKIKDKTFHYTNPEMVKYLLSKTLIKGSVLDAGSGKNKVWFNELKGEKYECEIDDGVDFFKWNKKVDWVVGNPPFHKGWLFIEQASKIAQKGIAFLGNLNFLNSCLPNRFEKLKKNGFYLQKIIIVQDTRWFGRYYYLIFEKKENDFLSWSLKTY